MRLPENRFKRRLAAAEPQFGLWLGIADPLATEIVAGAGYDWLVVDGEHAPNDLRSILAQLQVIAAYPASHPVVRLPIGDTVLIKQYLEIGAQTLLVPMVDTAGQAAAIVAATRYPPDGVRGVGAGLARSSRFSRIGDYVNVAAEEICVVVQVETARGLENLDAIAAVPGVDGVFFGPSDLSASLGFRGQSTHPAVRAAIEDGFRRVLAAGKAPGILAPVEEVARAYIAAGARFVALGADSSILSAATSSLLARFRPDDSGGNSGSGGY